MASGCTDVASDAQPEVASHRCKGKMLLGKMHRPLLIHIERAEHDARTMSARGDVRDVTAAQREGAAPVSPM
jgi:hypothetical protein